jgi:hypothetical protein
MVRLWSARLERYAERYAEGEETLLLGADSSSKTTVYARKAS